MYVSENYLNEKLGSFIKKGVAAIKKKRIAQKSWKSLHQSNMLTKLKSSVPKFKREISIAKSKGDLNRVKQMTKKLNNTLTKISKIKG